MTTLGEYKQKLATWSKSPSPEMVPWDDIAVFAYNRASKQIQPAELDAVATIDTSEGQGTNVRGKVWAYTAPTGLLRALSVSNNGVRVRAYHTAALQELDGSQPFGHALVGSEIWLAPGAGGDVKVVYNKQDVYPSEETASNHGLTEYLDAYIHAGLAAYYEWAEDMENEQRAVARFTGIADSLNMLAAKRRAGGGAGGIA